MRAAGARLSDPHDPAVRDALRRTCPECRQPPKQWCVGVAGSSRTQGRRVRRIHFARCEFQK